MLSIGVLADDLTGATTCAVLLARSSVKTVVFLESVVEAGGTQADDLQALVVSTNSRAMAQEAAYQIVREQTRVLCEKGVRYFSKRIDTTLRGGIGTEIDAMLDEIGNNTFAVVVPAMPQSRRIMVGGYSIIDGVALEDTNAAQDVVTPVRESFVPKLLQKQTNRKVGLIAFEDVHAGSERILHNLRALRKDGCEVIAVDAVSLADLDEIAKACTVFEGNILAVDPGAFTRQLAFRRGIAGEETSRMSQDCVPVKGKSVLIVAGSASGVTRRQITAFLQRTGRGADSGSPGKSDWHATAGGAGDSGCGEGCAEVSVLGCVPDWDRIWNRLLRGAYGSGCGGRGARIYSRRLR